MEFPTIQSITTDKFSCSTTKEPQILSAKERKLFPDIQKIQSLLSKKSEINKIVIIIRWEKYLEKQR